MCISVLSFFGSTQDSYIRDKRKGVFDVDKIAVITVTSIVCAAGFCDGGNYIAAAVSVIVLGITSEVIRRRYRHGKRANEVLARQHDRSA